MRLVVALLISICIFPSCNHHTQKMIIGEWQQVYDNPVDGKYMGYMIATFKQDNKGGLQN